MKQNRPPSHDEALKKLLQTFFAEFLELFLPEVAEQLDHRETRFLQQELLVDVVGGESRELDLLLATRFRDKDAYVLVHFEPQSYREADFHERMFIYFSRLFELYRKEFKLIIPIAVFSMDGVRQERDSIRMHVGEHEILQFRFLQVKLRSHNWRDFMDSDNPVAAALLAKMRYTKKEARELRTAYLRMLLRLGEKLDAGKLALIMSVADLYYKPIPQEDEDIIRELNEQGVRGGRKIMELMPAWKRWGYEEGLEKGIEQGMEQGIEKGIEKGMEKGLEQGLETAARNLIAMGMDDAAVIKATGLSPHKIRALRKLPEDGVSRRPN